MTSNEIVVIERMNECSINSRKRSFIERFPSNVVGTGMSVAPSAFIRSNFDFGAVSTTTTVHGTFAALAA